MQSAVSRQREFLADASAVQFTRNPAGLADALKKIGGNRSGATVQAAAADEMNHLFFAAGRRRWLSLLATHPPLEERILRLEPSFNGTFPASVPVTGFVEAVNTVQTPNLVPREPGLPPPLPSAPVAHEAIRIDEVLARPARMAEAVGDPCRPTWSACGRSSPRCPQDVTRALQDPPGACAVVLRAADLERGSACATGRSKPCGARGPQGLARDVNRLERDPLLVVPAPARLPMIDLALPALRQLSENQLAEFQVLIDTLMEADQDISLFEYALQHVLKRHLHAGSGRPRLAGNVIRGLAPVAGEVSVALSALARVGAARERDAAPAFEAGVKMLAAHGVPLRFLPPPECSLPILHECLDRLALTTFRLRRSILEACTRTIAYDRRIGAEEAELLRVLSDALDCPVPVWIRGAAED
ncbi:MAG: M48 family metalloprotease [Kiritimatiellia bacterium]